MWVTIKINGQYYEGRSDDLIELAEDFIKNIRYVCEVSFKEDGAVKFEWPGIDSYTFLRLKRKWFKDMNKIIININGVKYETYATDWMLNGETFGF